jgi:acyl carrier protein
MPPTTNNNSHNMDKTDFFAALVDKLQTFSPVPLDELSPNDKLFSSGLIDSLNIVEIIEFVEHYCGIQVKPTEFSMENFDSMASVAGYVEHKLASKN